MSGFPSLARLACAAWLAAAIFTPSPVRADAFIPAESSVGAPAPAEVVLEEPFVDEASAGPVVADPVDDPTALPPLPPKPERAFDPDLGLIADEAVAAPATLGASAEVPQSWGSGNLAVQSLGGGGGATTYALTATAQMETRVSAFDYDPVTGLLKREIVEPDNPAFRLETEYTFDDFGNRSAATVSASGMTSRETRYSYDSKGRLARTVKNPLLHTQTTVFDYDRGLPLEVTGPNGLTSEVRYDDFGRKVLEIAPDGQAVETEYFYCTGYGPVAEQVSCSGVTHARYVVVTTPRRYIWSTETLSGKIGPQATVYFDNMNRPLRTEVERTASIDDNGVETVKIATADTVYDNRGRTIAQSDAYFPGETVLWTTSTYDVLDRPLVVTGADGSVNTTLYLGLRVKTTRSAGGESRVMNTYRDSQGQTVKVLDHESKAVLFYYDPFGNLVRTRTAGGDEILATFDIRGQRTSLTDPDLGYRSYVYDAFGQLVSETDAKGQETTHTYDVLGRELVRTECRGICGAPGVQVELTTTTVYDTAAMGLGKPSSVSTDKGYVTSFTYDSLGRPSTATETLEVIAGIAITGQTATTTYDVWGRVRSTTTASGQDFYYDYTSLSTQWRVRHGIGGGESTATVFFKARTIDAGGTVTEEVLGNGVVTTRTVDRAKGVVTGITSMSGTTTVQKLVYSYDGFLNMTERDDQKTKVREAFQFDTRNRLIASAAERYNSAPVTYDPQTVTYDDRGNITSKSDVGSYAYGTDILSGAGPHAVASIVPNGTGAVDTAYTYDANGNTLTGNGRTYSWTSFDMPSTITRGAATVAFAYGPGHQRIKQTKPGETIHYFGGGTERVTDALGTRWVDYVSIGGRLVGSLTHDDGANLSTTVAAYYLTDHLGSLDRITDTLGAITESLDFDAWGRRRFPNGAAPILDTAISSSSRKGFTGHEMLDTLGLVHMNGRIYDPTVARFVSADPIIQAPYNLQSYNRYTYTLNNPLSYTDPSGFSWFSKAFKKIKKFYKKLWKGIADFSKSVARFLTSKQTLGLIFGLAVMAIATPLVGPIVAAMLGGAVQGYIATGSLRGAVRGAVAWGAAAAVTFGGAEFLGWDPEGYGLSALSEGTRAYIQSDGDLQMGGIAAVSAAAQVGFGKWTTTEWFSVEGVNPSEIVTDSIWLAKRTDWIAVIGKSLIKGAFGGTLGAVSGAKFNKAFWQSALPAASDEIYKAYVPWGSKIVVKGGKYVENPQDESVYIRNGYYEWGVYRKEGSIAQIGGPLSRFVSNYVPFMDSISKVHDMWAITGLNSVCFGQPTCPSTMLPAGLVTAGSVLDQNASKRWGM